MDKKISVKVCLGTTCFVMGSANLQELIDTVPAKYGDKVEVSGVPCLGLCSIDWEFSKAPYVKVDDEVIKEAVSQNGRKIVVDADLAIELFNERKTSSYNQARL